MKAILAVVMGILCVKAYTQGNVEKTDLSNRGKWYLTWGYNRAFYGESDVQFEGSGYNFTLHDMKGEDMPEAFTVKGYLSPANISIPQFNLRLGYFINDNTAISIGTDHMKYHFIQTQEARISGFIDDSYAPDSSLLAYTGTFDNETFLYREEFMNFHHSNGFNFVRVALEKRAQVWSSKRNKCRLAFVGAASAGIALPWTDFTFFGKNFKNRLHVSGIGFSACTGMRFEFAKFLFVQGNVQYGWTGMGDILLEDDKPSRAKQRITFLERSWSIGAYFGKRKA